jgi:hypothetical protein
LDIIKPHGRKKSPNSFNGKTRAQQVAKKQKSSQWESENPIANNCKLTKFLLLWKNESQQKDQIL